MEIYGPDEHRHFYRCQDCGFMPDVPGVTYEEIDANPDHVLNLLRRSGKRRPVEIGPT